jgi:hypothetical protein
MSSGSVYQRSPGSYRIKYEIGRDPITGKRRTGYKTVKGTKKEAQQELRRLQIAVDQGMYTNPGKLTVGKYLTDWLSGRRHSIAPKTAERYDELIHRPPDRPPFPGQTEHRSLEPLLRRPIRAGPARW